MGSNSHRYEATGWESQHYDTVKAVAEIFRISMKHTRFFRNSTEFFSNYNNAIAFTFSEALLGQGVCRYVQKIRHTGS